MKRILKISVICLLSIIVVLLLYYFYIQYQAYIYRKHDAVPPVEITWVDTTKEYTVGELLAIPQDELLKVKKLDLIFEGDYLQGDKGAYTFPPIVSQLNNLEYIDFSWNEISDLRPIQQLKQLKKIILYRNQVETLDGFKVFKYLNYLDISGNQLVNLRGIEELHNLQFLDFRRNKNLSDIKGIEKLTRLEELIIGGNKFDSFPVEIVQLKNLKKLSIDNNHSSFPDSFYIVGLPKIHQLKQLRELSLSWNNIPVLDVNFQECENLERFSYTYNVEATNERYYTGELPPWGERYWKFKDIDVEDILNRVSKAPKLKNLNLSNNRIYGLPNNIVLPDSLEVLDLSNTQIKRFPIITKAPELKNLDLSDNLIYSLPNNIVLPDNLEVLDLSNTRIKRFPVITKASKLKNLNLIYNSIYSLPNNIVLPDSLEVLNLSYNKIKRLPIGITKYKNLKYVQLYSNPIDTIAIKEIERMMSNTKFYYDKK